MDSIGVWMCGILSIFLEFLVFLALFRVMYRIVLEVFEMYMGILFRDRFKFLRIFLLFIYNMIIGFEGDFFNVGRKYIIIN